MLTAAEYEKLRANGTITFEHCTRIKIWAGWYEKTIIRYNGEYAGDIQRKRQYKRESYHTGVNGAGVMGIDPLWAVNYHLSNRSE